MNTDVIFLLVEWVWLYIPIWLEVIYRKTHSWRSLATSEQHTYKNLGVTCWSYIFQKDAWWIILPYPTTTETWKTSALEFSGLQFFSAAVRRTSIAWMNITSLGGGVAGSPRVKSEAYVLQYLKAYIWKYKLHIISATSLFRHSVLLFLGAHFARSFRRWRDLHIILLAPMCISP